MGNETTPGFWGTLPGVLTGVAALVTAVGGIFLSLKAADGQSEDKFAKRGATAVTTTSTAAESTTDADVIAGRWSGPVHRQDGSTFNLFLEVKKPCHLNDQCGTISVSDVPCYGQVFLQASDGNRFEFLVDNFFGGYNRLKCSKGAGEFFMPGPNDTLLYSAGYEGITRGTLTRAG